MCYFMLYCSSTLYIILNFNITFQLIFCIQCYMILQFVNIYIVFKHYVLHHISVLTQTTTKYDHFGVP